MIVGTVGIVVPVLPGLIVVWGATLVWAFERQDGPGWLVLGITTLLYAAGIVAQYLLPGRRMKTAGVESGIVAVALVVAVVGFFVVPVVGGPLGFVLAIYVLERIKRREHAGPWASTSASSWRPRSQSSRRGAWPSTSRAPDAGTQAEGPRRRASGSFDD